METKSWHSFGSESSFYLTVPVSMYNNPRTNHSLFHYASCRFTPLRQKAKEPPQELPHDGFPWPPISPAALGSNITAQEPFDWTVKTGATNSMFRFILYKRGQHSATGTGGQTTAGPTVTATTTTATTAGQMTTTTIQTATTTGQISVPIAPTTTTSGTS